MDVKILWIPTPTSASSGACSVTSPSEGGRAESVIAQYLRTVRPMHLEFVEPSKRYADVIIPEGGFNEVAIDMVAGRLRGLVAEAG